MPSNGRTSNASPNHLTMSDNRIEYFDMQEHSESVQDNVGNDRQAHEEHSLPPTDHGKGAWGALVACCAIQAPTWGISYIAGILQSYYTEHRGLLKGDLSNVALIGTTASGVLYLSTPVLFTILARWPGLRPWCGPVGLLIMTSSLIASTFVSSTSILVVTQGVLQAIGSGLLYAPATLYLDEWFVHRRGLAYGVMLSAKGLAGTVLPLIFQPSLERFGYKTTIRAWTIYVVLVTAPVLYFSKPRIPVARSITARRLDTTFLKLPLFWMFQLGNLFQSLGYFLPTAYLDPYATSIGLSPWTATLLLALLNAVCVLGNPIIGMLIDRISVTTTVLVLTIGSTVSALLLWGLASKLAILVSFVVFYGFFAGGYSSTWSGMLTELKRQAPSTDTGLIYGLFSGGRGIGNVLSGPLSVTLMAHPGALRNAKPWGYGSEYGPVIIWVGATALLGGWAWGFKTVKALV